jgi:hypothetical protein
MIWRWLFCGWWAVSDAVRWAYHKTRLCYLLGIDCVPDCTQPGLTITGNYRS